MEWTRIVKSKLYNIEYTKNGDGISNFIDNIKVEANDEKEAIEIAKQKRPDGWNFNIVNKSYENSELVNKDSEVKHDYQNGYWDGNNFRTESKMNKTASKSGSDNGEFEQDYEDVELIVNGEKKKCDILIEAYFEFDWYYEEQTYWEPGDRSIEKLDISIENIYVSDKDGNEYSEEQNQKILEDNREYLESLIEDDIETKAYEMDWETW